MPIGGAGVRQSLPQLHAAMEAAGRDPAELTIIPFGVLADAGKIDYYAEIGFDEVVFRVPPAPAEVVLPIMDRLASFVEG